jgi:pSer/pThr/pTyr-binding forkhead associated (FHA) protein
MAKLVINSVGAQNRTLELRPGANRFGRANTNEFQLDDPSVSSAHCEILQSDQSVVVN